MKILLLAFRGTGFRDARYQAEPALLKAGHVGLLCEGDTIIYGFHPTPEAAEAVGGEAESVNSLKNHVAQPGQVQNDTAVFERAHTLYQEGGRTEVIALTYEVPNSEFERIHTQLVTWYNTGETFQYNFPDYEGKFESQEYNCATFPRLLGFSLPSDSGNLVDYIDDMREKGAVTWQPQI